MSQKNHNNKKVKNGADKEEVILQFADITHSNSTAIANDSRGDMFITLSEDQLMKIMSNVVTKVLNRSTINKRTSNTFAVSYSTSDFRRNFSGFTARFNGVVKNPGEFESFVDSLAVYKDWASISDQYALRHLPKLLTGTAGKWWRSVKSTIKTWDEAIYQLRSKYGAPAYKILQEIFEEKQGDQSVEAFISRAREKFLRLPYRVPDVIQVDIVYGLLNPRIRECILLEDLPADLYTLIARANDVEDMLNETMLLASEDDSVS